MMRQTEKLQLKLTSFFFVQIFHEMYRPIPYAISSVFFPKILCFPLHLCCIERKNGLDQTGRVVELFIRAPQVPRGLPADLWRASRGRLTSSTNSIGTIFRGLIARAQHRYGSWPAWKLTTDQAGQARCYNSITGGVKTVPGRIGDTTGLEPMPGKRRYGDKLS